MTLRDQAIELRNSLVQLYENSSRFATGKSDGFTRYQSAIKAEIKYLDRLLKQDELLDVKQESLSGCNYYHLESIYKVLLQEGGGQVYPKFYFNNDEVRVDVATPSKWIKIKARKKYHFEEEDEEEDLDSSSDEEEDAPQLAIPEPKIIKQAEKLITAAKLNCGTHFEPPIVVFQFVRLECPLPSQIERKLKDLGVQIEFGLQQPCELSNHIRDQSTSVLNLDIPTLIGMVSCITFDFEYVCPEAFDSTPLKIQYKDEKINPLLPTLVEILADKTLVCTIAAFDKFKTIIEMIGGPKEQQRAFSIFNTADYIDSAPLENIPVLFPQPKLDLEPCEDILEWKVYVIENRPSEHILSLKQARLDQFHVDIFGTGDELRITTVTANSKVQRSIDKAGNRKHAILLHEPRGLIEQKWIRYSTGTYNNATI